VEERSGSCNTAGRITEDTFKYGDVNGDFAVNSNDLTLIKRYVLKNIDEFPSPHGLKAADVDGDEKITSSDAALVKRYVLRAITSFPVEENQNE